MFFFLVFLSVSVARQIGSSSIIDLQLKTGYYRLSASLSLSPYRQQRVLQLFAKISQILCVVCVSQVPEMAELV